MSIIQDSDYILFKALSESITKGLASHFDALNSKCLVELSEYEKLKNQFLNCNTFDEVGDNANKLKSLQDKLISKLAVQDRIEKIIKRNNQRLDFVNNKLQQMGIYNYAVDKKTILKTLSAEAKNVSEKSLNLNLSNGENLKYMFFNGEILTLKDGKLDFEIKSNGELLKTASPEFYHEMISTFPYAVATIPDEYYMVPNIKNNVLKECVLYAAAKIKTQTLASTNNELGGLLSNAENLSSISDFAKALKNYFNVCVKQCMKKNAPQLESDINQTLRCNEASEFLPSSKRVAVLANGVAGDAPKTEEQENEEIRKEQEKETQMQDSLSKEELLKLMLEDDEDEMEEVQDSVEDAKLAKEEKKLADEKQEKEEIEALEKQMELALKKNNVVED